MSDKKAGGCIHVKCRSEYYIMDIQQLTCLPNQAKRNWSAVSAMAASLAQDGLLEPPVVWFTANHTYLIDGYTRLFALNYLRARWGYRIPPIPVYKVRPKNLAEAEQLALRLNGR